MGHSIGSWMILKLLQKLSKKIALLFPTIQMMGITPNITLLFWTLGCLFGAGG